MQRYCLTLDLKPDDALIADYEKHHQKVWPEIEQTFAEAGIEHMEIYRWGNRLFMIMEVNDTFSFDKKAQSDAANATVQKWEALVGQYQQQLPGAKPDEKWQLMKKIYTY